MDALQEVAAWLADPLHSDQLLVLFLDDQRDLATWGKLPLLMDQISAHFPPGSVLTPPAARALVAAAALAAESGGRGLSSPPPAPSVEALVNLGYRVLVLSGTDYGEEMDALIFSKCVLGEGGGGEVAIEALIYSECSLGHGGAIQVKVVIPVTFHCFRSACTASRLAHSAPTPRPG